MYDTEVWSWLRHILAGGKQFPLFHRRGKLSLTDPRTQPGQPDYLKYLQAVLDSLDSAGKELAIFLPAYTLAPHAVYPAQLAQGVDTLRYVVYETGHKASDVILSGDSAGGNMALAVLSHLSHPHKEIPPLELAASLKGVFVISPWTSASLEYASIGANKYKDVIPSEASDYWMNTYKGGVSVPSDAYTEAAIAPASWWENARTQDMLVLAGREEILLGAIEEFVDKYKVSLIIWLAAKGFANMLTRSSITRT